MSVKTEEKIEKVCVAAVDKLTALGIEDQLIAEINWCLGSYANDHNPVGLYEKANVALDVLGAYKEKYPRKVAKKLIDDLKSVSQN